MRIEREVVDGTEIIRSVAEPGDPEYAEAEIHKAADEAIDKLEAAANGWGSLTAAQKDAALRLSVRVVAKLARLALGRLT